MTISSERLDTLVRVRTTQERRALTEFLHIQERKRIEQEFLQTLRHQHDTMVEQGNHSERTRAADVRALRAFLRDLHRSIERQEKTVDSVESEAVRKHEALVEMEKAKKIIETLRDRIREEETKEAERKEQRLIDVLAQRARPSSEEP